MKKKPRPPLGLPRRQFVALIQESDFKKIETSLQLPAPSEGFRKWLIKVIWLFYRNSGEHVWNSRNILKDELRKSAELAADLKVSAHRLWQSREAAVIESLSELVEWQPWQSSRRMHRSGIPWVALLDELAKRAARLADELPDDTGGDRDRIAFDHLLMSLWHYYRVVMRDRHQPIKRSHYSRFAAEVTATLRRMRKRLPARDLESGRLEVSLTDEALYRHISRMKLMRSQPEGVFAVDHGIFEPTRQART